MKTIRYLLRGIVGLLDGWAGTRGVSHSWQEIFAGFATIAYVVGVFFITAFILIRIAKRKELRFDKIGFYALTATITVIVVGVTVGLIILVEMAFA